MSRSTLFIETRISLALPDAKNFNAAMRNNNQAAEQTTQGLSKPSFSAAVRDWFHLAAHPATARRAFITAIIVGTILIAINHGPAILSGQVTHARIFQMCLTVIVPYTVSTVSSVSTRRELRARLDSATPPSPPE